ncbi:MAG: peptide-methionine (S)-S-oxide reductase MsrA [Gammaproteobacteria bacterium]|nr:peptide-methionine (S)-S-oxide reductase MsrA [Gammaproteobacteria bacterium]NIN61054.1 peptide-methionine (S)-S-oxide reductase MsrA [Gammaproteobacteria bacterium]NIO62677.1 peptide-methionine (S)-S-oxide reductase MsrA [Gammaproteobacteria bacterium]NIP49406.1 peptide-methionine (S)-S-oxide reductase MsrA [Gammaproteobacteria bacterium]NIQ10630.1 peptide-methionine (S)-S-oxide reductase MsrA [Gammaproteobacteria bacterium]
MRQLVFFLLISFSSFSVFAETAVATFAGGCFWCMEPPYDKLDGVISTTSGYTGGHLDNPTYKQVSSGKTGHYEAVQVEYDPDRVSYQELLDVFWANVDLFDSKGQFCDKGPQYRAAIFVQNDEEEKLARLSKQALEGKTGKGLQVVTEILPTSTFYPAEEYHQDYYQKNPVRYNYYRFACGRDRRLEDVQQLIN